MTISVLTIAGSDSGGGAGIQADLKTFAAHRVHGLSAIAALTAQNTRGVSGVAVTDPAFIAEQIDACFADFDIRAVKLGMLADAVVINAVSDALERQHPVPVVLDPVMVATSGAALLDPDAVGALLDRLLPMATIVTPNIPEAEVLLARHIVDADDALEAARALLARGCRGALVKGGHLRGGRAVIDTLALQGGRVERFEHPRLDLEAH
ncbi:bifunctional hydroxymethylpyrimidine kinase/phosphomethylpyrimidine kinase, partial [Lysobacter xanthus]